MAVRPHLMALLLLFVATGCRTTGEPRVPSTGTSAAASDETLAVTPGEPECPVEDVVCGQEEEAVLCSAAVYSGRLLPLSLGVRAWGSNRCTGRVALAKEACAKGLMPSKLGQVQCVPDASGGNCPPSSVACGPEVVPSVCSAARYGDQSLSEGQVLLAWGTNPCLAKESLAALACQRNLDPNLLDEVVCGSDPQNAECPPSESLCEDAPRESACEVVRMLGTLPAQLLEATGDSTCEAKQKLMRLVCMRGLKLSDIEDVVCRLGK